MFLDELKSMVESNEGYKLVKLSIRCKYWQKCYLLIYAHKTCFICKTASPFSNISSDKLISGIVCFSSKVQVSSDMPTCLYKQLN